MSYLQDRLAQYGISVDAPINQFPWTDLDLGGATQHCQYFVEHEQGIEIHTPTAYGDRPHHVVRGKKKFISRLRLSNPIQDEDGNDGRYRFTTKFAKDHANDIKGSWFFIPPGPYEKIRKEEKIKTLWLTEGEFKSFIPAKWGLDICGLPGIQNFREYSKGPLLDQIVNIIQRCRVENVVIFFDSDCIDLSTKIGKDAMRSASYRPANFMKAVDNLRRLLLSHEVNVYFGHIKPDPDRKWGLDDLFETQSDDSNASFTERCQYQMQRLQDTFHKAYTRQPHDDDRFVIHDITEATGYDPKAERRYNKLKRIFKLTNVREFWEYHKTRQLAGFKSFKFGNILYEIQQDVPILHDDQTKLINPIQRIGNAYFTRTKDGDQKQLSDFVVDLHYIIYVDANDTRRIATFTNTSNKSYFGELSKKDMSSTTTFEEKINSWPKFHFFGSKRDLTFIKAMMEYDNQVISAQMIKRLGWQADQRAWAWANGLSKDGKFYPVNDYGLVTIDGEGYFLPAFSKIRSLSEDYKDAQWFRIIDGWGDGNEKISWDNWRDIMYQVHSTPMDHNGLFAVCFPIMALFGELIFKQLKFLPMLYLTGIPQSGKNSMGQSIIAMFGEYMPPTNINFMSSTAANRICAQYINSVVWLDEWKNNLPTWKQELVKSAFDRTGKLTATYSNDDKTQRTEYRSAIMVSGQDIPGHGGSDAALANRGITCFFRRADRTPEEKARFDQLKEIEKKGLQHITLHILRGRKIMEEEFSTYYTKVETEIRAAIAGQNLHASARLVAAYAAMLTPGLLLQSVGHLSLGMTQEQVIAIAVNKILQQDKLSQESNEISVFWQIVERLYTMHDPNNNDNIRDGYEIRIEPDTLYIRLNRVYDRYYRYGKKNDKNVLDQNTLRDYLKSHKAYYKPDKRNMYFRDGTTATPMAFLRQQLPEAKNILSYEEKESMRVEFEGAAKIELPPANGHGQQQVLLKGEYEALQKQNQ